MTSFYVGATMLVLVRWLLLMKYFLHVVNVMNNDFFLIQLSPWKLRFFKNCAIYIMTHPKYLIVYLDPADYSPTLLFLGFDILL